MGQMGRLPQHLFNLFLVCLPAPFFTSPGVAFRAVFYRK